jgi:hypothetical protein
MIFKNLVPRSQKTHGISDMKANQVMLFSKIHVIAAYRRFTRSVHTLEINTACE